MLQRTLHQKHDGDEEDGSSGGDNLSGVQDVAVSNVVGDILHSKN